LAPLAVTACATSDPAQPVHAYFDHLNAAAANGTSAAFFRATQDPEFTDRYCDIGGLAITEQPTWSTLRPDPKWAPAGGRKPSGDVYVVAVLLTAKRGGSTVATQIASARVIVRDGHAYGFSPCGAS
jgi:hypothetical protein